MTLLPPDGDEPPLAWGYVAPPTFYPHAGAQYRRRLTLLAVEKGFLIDRWFSDVDGATHGITTMWRGLPGSGVKGLFVPDPRHMWFLPRFKGLTVTQIRDELPFELFVLDERFAPIFPPEDPGVNIIRTPVEPPRRRRPRWLLRAS